MHVHANIVVNVVVPCRAAVYRNNQYDNGMGKTGRGNMALLIIDSFCGVKIRFYWWNVNKRFHRAMYC